MPTRSGDLTRRLRAGQDRSAARVRTRSCPSCALSNGPTPQYLFRQPDRGGEDGSFPPSCWPPPALLGVSLSHLALVCGKCSQHLPFLPLGHLEEVQRSPKFSRDFVELGGRDLQLAMSFFQAERSTAWLRGGILLGAT